jgi:hypothetical protein
VRNGLADHWRKSYVAKGGKSMQAVELAAARKDGWRNIAITLIFARDGSLSVIAIRLRTGC